MPGHGMGFSDTEASDLLDAIEEVPPIGMDEWGMVLRQHEVKYPEGGRTRKKASSASFLLFRKGLVTPLVEARIRTAEL